VSGEVAIALGVGAVFGDWVHINFAHPYKVAPNIVITPADCQTSQILGFVNNITTTGFSINACSNALTHGQPAGTFTWYYVVVETK